VERLQRRVPILVVHHERHVHLGRALGNHHHLNVHPATPLASPSEVLASPSELSASPKLALRVTQFTHLDVVLGQLPERALQARRAHAPDQRHDGEALLHLHAPAHESEHTQSPAGGKSSPLPRRWRGAERRQPTGRERTGSPTLYTRQDPILLVPWVCFQGGGFQTRKGFQQRGQRAMAST
jgi:hypothetical protein